MPEKKKLNPPATFLNRELSWLSFAQRVIALAENEDIPLLERVRFVAISGMLHDEFFMKRISGMKRLNAKGSTKLSLDGRTPKEEFEVCQRVLHEQAKLISKLLDKVIFPRMAEAGIAILDYSALERGEQKELRKEFELSVLPILTPLAVDPEHPFPFVSNLGLNLAVILPKEKGSGMRFVRVEVPNNHERWMPVPGGRGFVPLEQVIASNLDLLYPTAKFDNVHLFRVTRGADGGSERPPGLGEDNGEEPGSIVNQVSSELKARRFAGVVRLQVSASMPKKLCNWLVKQLRIEAEDVYPIVGLLGLNDLSQLRVSGRPELSFTPHVPAVHPRLADLPSDQPGEIFAEIRRGDLMVHHPYHSFDTSVLRFIQAAAEDPSVLAIKLTIYRTSSDSPIVVALADAARRGKQVAVVVEVTARFDEAPNIAWGRLLEKEGVHVAYGVEQYKTHVKLALVVRREGGELRRYAHVGTGNYHPGTARIYEDLGILTCEPQVCEDVSGVLNTLTGVTPHEDRKSLLVAPLFMRKRFVKLIHREIEHAQAGRPAGIDAKMNQLQDPEMIRELYKASRKGVKINLIVRGLCCLRPQVEGLSENIRLFSVVGRFLEHSRIFRFVNGGSREYFIGSADWMKRNLSSRVETILLVSDEELKLQIGRILEVYMNDNCSAWDCGPEGDYVRRTPADGEERRAAQEVLRSVYEEPDRFEWGAPSEESAPLASNRP